MIEALFWLTTQMRKCHRTDLNSSSKFVGISSPVEKTLNGKIQFQPRIRFRTACHRHEPTNKLLAPQLQVFSQIEDDLSAVVRRSLPPPEEKYYSTQHTHSKPTHKTTLHIQAGVISLSSPSNSWNHESQQSISTTPPIKNSSIFSFIALVETESMQHLMQFIRKTVKLD